jgi:DNA-binding transcriptional LysR family regulator
MLRNNKITAFISLAETLNYTQTAKQMYMSQQAVSKLITSLENDIGEQLFIRTTRSVAMTPAGKMYYQLYKKLLKEYDQGESIIKENLAGDNRRRVRIGIQSYMDAAPIRRIIDDMKENVPGCALQVICAPPSVMIDQFQRDLLDMVVLLSRFLPDGFDAKAETLTTNPLYIMLSDKHPLATGDAELDNLISLPYISDMLDGEDSLAHEARMKHEFDMWNLKPSETIWTYDRDSAFLYAEFGYGIVIDSNRSSLLNGRSLKMYETGKTESLLLLHHDNAAETPETNRLIETFIKVFASRSNDPDS